MCAVGVSYETDDEFVALELFNRGACVSSDNRDPPHIKRPAPTAVRTDWGERGFSITHLHDLTENRDALVVMRNDRFVTTDVVVVRHDGDRRLVYDLFAQGKLRAGVVGLLATGDCGQATGVSRAWRVTTRGRLHEVPIEGLACRRLRSGDACDTTSNLEAVRGRR